MTELYYTAPSDEIFDEVKQEALKIWGSYDDPYRIVKQDRIRDIRNISDNVMYMVAMFDLTNQAKLATNLSEDARRAIGERIQAGGGMFNPFIS